MPLHCEHHDRITARAAVSGPLPVSLVRKRGPGKRSERANMQAEGGMDAGAEPTPPELENALARLRDHKTAWAKAPVSVRNGLLKAVRGRVATSAEAWVRAAAERKGLPSTSPLVAEEWSSGPWALLTAIDVLIRTLDQIEQGRYLRGLQTRTTDRGQVAARVFPQGLFDKLLLSGVSAEVWMEPGVSQRDLRASQPRGYSKADRATSGSVALVLGAGNITSIAPSDALYKLYSDNSVVLLKLNPVTDYLKPIFDAIFAPLIGAGYLEIVNGDATAGALLTRHPDVDTIHITGSGASHDAIVFGTGPAGALAKAADTPINPRPVTSELGAVCPTIIVPGRWTKADLRFQAEHVATQKLHNSGFNCVAAQILVLPRDWPQADAFLDALKAVLARLPGRPLYYPGSADRMKWFRTLASNRLSLKPQTDEARILAVLDVDDEANAQSFSQEIFGPALGIVYIDGADPARYLRTAISFANARLHGSLGANVIIDPATEKDLGASFEGMIADLHYGCIAINAWTGLGFLLAHAPWGAFPGHVRNDIQSGQGVVHNAFLFAKPERTIVRAPFRPFPRGLRHGNFATLPRPPWFVTNRTAVTTARRLFAFQAKPSWFTLLGIIASALRG
jgi:acyl-CoA reductase-like NAD-dependent aldehyde dehydrogenase